MKTILELVSEMERLSSRQAVVYHDGLRTFRLSYRQLLNRIAAASAALEARGVGPGDRVLLWGENRPEWLAVFWAGVLSGATIIPIDFRSSPSFASRVTAKTEPRLVAHGASVEVQAVAPGVSRLAFAELHDAARSGPAYSLDVAKAGVTPQDVFQILFTSGTTGDPKGIVHRHSHIVPALETIGREFTKYRGYARSFQPIRFLELLPLSHVFGQFAGLFLPVVIGGAVVFMKENHPQAILQTVRRERVSVLITVPRFLHHLRSDVERRFSSAARASDRPRGFAGALVRWWRHRDIHAAFSFKFWAVLSGGAPLALDDESFWSRLGFVVIQGYGLTETTSVVTTNHPFKTARGSLGKPVGAQEVKLAPDGEILVRGPNVSLERYGEKPAADAEAWLATGDLGELGPDGTLYFKGRKKDVIVGADGMNVFPSDVEAALTRQPEVRDAVVVGRSTDQGDVVHAVLLLAAPDADPGAAVARANEDLEPHQRIREHTVWPEEDFPRTVSTFKVRRNEVAAAVRGGALGATTPQSAAAKLVARLSKTAAKPGSGERLSEDLGLTSLDRIELLGELEQTYGIALSEASIAEVKTVAELESLVHQGTTSPPTERRRSPLSGIVRFAQSRPARALRFGFREAVILPLFRHYIPLTIEGSANVASVTPPVLFAPNHTSNLDTLAVLAALPHRLRHRLAPAASQEYFRPYLDGTGPLGERLWLGFQFWLGTLTVGLFPLPQSPGGVKEALEFAGKLVDQGHSILIFPEGRRSPDGKQHPFFPGVGLLAVRLRIPVVPIHLDGLFEILPVHETWPKPGPAHLRFGAPLHFGETEDYREATRRIEQEVRRMSAIAGAARST